MEAAKKPTLEQFQEYVRKFEKRVGLRKMYKDFGIPKSAYHKYRQVWNRFWETMPDAYGKDEEDAGRIGSTKAGNGNRGTSSGETISKEPRSFEDEEKSTA